MGEQSIEAAVVETVQDAADEAVAAVEREAEISHAAERVEDAAEAVEDAAAAHREAAAAPDIGEIIAAHMAPIHSRLDGIESRLDPTPVVIADAVDEAGGDEGIVGDAPDPEEIAESVVDEIIDRADEAVGEVDDATPDAGDLPEVADALPDTEAASEVVDDTPPRKTHWMNRSVFGRKG
jgi:hypothetical protein